MWATRNRKELFSLNQYLRVVGGCVALVVAVVVIGCGKQPIAVVGQHKITRAEFIEKLEKEQGHSALVGMINRLLLEDAFAASGLTITPEEVQERVEEIKSRFPSPEAFAQALAAQGQTEQNITEEIALNLKLQKLCMKDVQVSEADLKAFFEENKQLFSKPETVDYSEIVVSTEEEAKKVAGEARKADANFGALARQYSISQMTRERGGAVRDVMREHVYPESVQATLRALSPGQVSDPVEGDGRWYVVRLDRVNPAQEPNFERDRERVEEAVKGQRAKQPQELLMELRETAVVNVVDPRYADVNEAFRPRPTLPEFGATPGEGAE